MSIVIFIFTLLFIYFYKIVVVKTKGDINVSFYALKFLDAKIFEQNSSLKLFLSKLSYTK